LEGQPRTIPTPNTHQCLAHRSYSSSPVDLRNGRAIALLIYTAAAHALRRFGIGTTIPVDVQGASSFLADLMKELSTTVTRERREVLQNPKRNPLPTFPLKGKECCGCKVTQSD
jgi:hypothetical protein